MSDINHAYTFVAPFTVAGDHRACKRQRFNINCVWLSSSLLHTINHCIDCRLRRHSHHNILFRSIRILVPKHLIVRLNIGFCKRNVSIDFVIHLLIKLFFGLPRFIRNAKDANKNGMLTCNRYHCRWAGSSCFR